MLSKLAGPLLIALASILWGTDALFRFPTAESVDPTFIVLFEHAVGTLLLLPWILFSYRGQYTKFKPLEWLSLFVIGVGGSAFATVLFTASFHYVNPSVSILLQKTQPILVVLLAMIFLGERPRPGFYGWAVLAIFAAVVIGFPDFNFTALANGMDMRSKGMVLALSAAALWALATVAGKHALKSHPFGIVTFWRYLFGLIALIVMVCAAGQPIPNAILHGVTLAQGQGTVVIHAGTVIRALLYISLLPGVAALLLYYAGLKLTSASVATFVELIFPVSAVILNAVFLNQQLYTSQIFAGIVLIFAVTRIPGRV